jgi:hypothetical protein
VVVVVGVVVVVVVVVSCELFCELLFVVNCSLPIVVNC